MRIFPKLHYPWTPLPETPLAWELLLLTLEHPGCLEQQMFLEQQERASVYSHTGTLAQYVITTHPQVVLGESIQRHRRRRAGIYLALRYTK